MGIRSIRATAGVALVAAAWGGAVWARDFPALAPPARETQPSATVACVQPPEMVSWEDYHGPLQKVVGAFGRRLERKSAHAPHYKPGAVLCVLSLHDKFLLSVRETFDPVTVLGIAYDVPRLAHLFTRPLESRPANLFLATLGEGMIFVGLFNHN